MEDVFKIHKNASGKLHKIDKNGGGSKGGSCKWPPWGWGSFPYHFR